MNQVSVRPRVLVVDDEQAVLLTTSAILEDDFDVEVSSSPAEAMALLRKADFDVVCSDYNMPGMNGVEFFRAAIAERPHLSTILITGYQEFLATNESAGGNDRYHLLVKPYEPATLIGLIQKVFKFSAIKRQLHKPASAVS